MTEGIDWFRLSVEYLALCSLMLVMGMVCSGSCGVVVGFGVLVFKMTVGM